MFDVNAYLCSAIVAGSGSGVVGMNRRVETEGAWHVHPARSAGVNHVMATYDVGLCTEGIDQVDEEMIMSDVLF